MAHTRPLCFPYPPLSALLSILVLFVWAAPAQGQDINLIAGDGSYSHSGDGGLGVSAGVAGPVAVAVDSWGTAYVAELYGYSVRQVDWASGVITTVAGSSYLGFTPEETVATAAQFQELWGVALDEPNNLLYISDGYNRTVSVVDLDTGLISLAAGQYQSSGGGNFIGVGPLWPGEGDGGLAVDAPLSFPAGLAVDNQGNLYIADLVDSRIRKIDTAGFISTVAGLDYGGETNGEGIPATSAYLWNPTAVAVGDPGHRYISDRSNMRVRMVEEASGLIYTIAGVGYPDAENLTDYAADATQVAAGYPKGLVVDIIGDVFFADAYNQRIWRIGTGGELEAAAGTGTAGYSGDGGPAIDARLNGPTGLSFHPNGCLYIGDADNYRVREACIAEGCEDSDGDGICDEQDICDGDDATGDPDDDGICGDQDECYGENATGDADLDGLCADTEDDIGTDDQDMDTDDDGLTDGEEYMLMGTDPLDVDSDADGLQDGQELGLAAAPTADTDTAIFVPDEEPASTTDPMDEDTDDGGLGDGEEDLDLDGAYEPNDGECDPNNGSDDEDCMPGDDDDASDDDDDDDDVEDDDSADDDDSARPNSAMTLGCNCGQVPNEGRRHVGWALLPAVALAILGIRRRS